jgi:DnaJ-class molecular chaperone
LAAQNYYQVLGVGRGATEDEIKQAYRALVPKYHPDVNPGDAKAAEKFKEINRAYETLKDPEKRKAYDVSSGPGRAGPTGSRGTARGVVTDAPNASGQKNKTPGSPDSGHPLADILEAMRGAARRDAGPASAPSPEARGAEAGPNASTVDIWLTPREAIEGTTRKILVNGRPIHLRIRVRR